MGSSEVSRTFVKPRILLLTFDLTKNSPFFFQGTGDELAAPAKKVNKEMSPLDKLLAEKKKSGPGSAKEEKKQAEDLRKKLNAKKAEEEDIEESDDEDDDSEDADDSDDDDANDFINDEADGKFLNFPPIIHYALESFEM